MEIKVEKLTDVSLLQRANSFTTGHDSHMTLEKAYKHQHSPVRTQLFWIEMRDIPLFCASQFVRSHVGVQWFQRSKRTDRGGEDFRAVCDAIATKAGVIYVDELVSQYDDDLEHDIAYRDELAKEIRELPNRFDRYAPTDLACLINAEAIINMSHKRLCTKASKETREIWEEVIMEIKEIDRDLACFCQKPCIATGICREPKGCGYIDTKAGQILRTGYINLFE